MTESDTAVEGEVQDSEKASQEEVYSVEKGEVSEYKEKADGQEYREKDTVKEKLIEVLMNYGHSEEGLEGLSNEELIKIAKSETSKDKELSDVVNEPGLYERFVEKLPSSIRWIFEALQGASDIEKDSLYEKILMHDDVVLLFPGLLGIPYKQRFGNNVARVGTYDVDEINDIINFSVYVNGKKPGIIGYSGGSKRIKDYIDKYGSDNVGDTLILGGLSQVPGAYHIDAEKDRVIPFFRELYGLPAVVPNKTIGDIGHWDLVYNPNAIKEVREYFKLN